MTERKICEKQERASKTDNNMCHVCKSKKGFGIVSIDLQPELVKNTDLILEICLNCRIVRIPEQMSVRF
jgi:hypothetical protein